MKLVLTLLTTFLLLAPAVSSANTTIHQDPLEIGLFPGISAYPYVKLPYRSTVDGHHYYVGDSAYYKNDRLLLVKSLDFYSKSLSYSDAIIKYDEKYQALMGVLDKIDWGKKIEEKIALYAGDVKAAAYFAWDFYSPNIKKALGDPLLFDVIAESIKGIIDVSLEYSGFNTVLFKKYFNKLLLEGLGRAFAYYDGVLNSVRLFGTLYAIDRVQDLNSAESLEALKLKFINDYVIEYNSDISLMKNDLLSKVENEFLKENYKKYMTNFWSVWVLYATLVNDNKTLVNKVLSDYKNPPYDGKGGWFGEFAKAGMEVNHYINKYGHGIYFSVFTPKLKPINSRGYVLTYETPSAQQVNNLYFMPKDLSVLKFEFGAGVLSKNYSFLKEVNLKTTQASLKTVVGLNGFGDKISENNRYVSYVNNYSIDINVFGNNVLLANEKMSESVKNFFIPAYLGGMSEKDYSNKNIARLFNDRVVTGNKDGSFNAKGNITIGELLKVVSLSLMKDGGSSESIKNEGSVAFSKYRKFLSDKGINVGEDGGTVLPNDKLSTLATRGYMAKLLSNIIRSRVYGKTQIVTCKNPKIFYKSDWDTCSWELQENEYVAPNDNYRKDDNIARDEVFAILNRILTKNGGGF
jgi:hypothetical protein